MHWYKLIIKKEPINLSCRIDIIQSPVVWSPYTIKLDQ